MCAVVDDKEDEEEVKNVLGTLCVPMLCVAVEKTWQVTTGDLMMYCWKVGTTFFKWGVNVG